MSVCIVHGVPCQSENYHVTVNYTDLIILIVQCKLHHSSAAYMRAESDHINVTVHIPAGEATYPHGVSFLMTNFAVYMLPDSMCI